MKGGRKKVKWGGQRGNAASLCVDVADQDSPESPKIVVKKEQKQADKYSNHHLRCSMALNAIVEIRGMGEVYTQLFFFCFSEKENKE